MKSILLCAIIMGVPLLVSAEDGYVHGENHCFYFSAPKGWVADYRSGKSQGLAFVFYPVNSSYSKATTFIYTMVVDKSKDLQSPKEQVDKTLQRFHTKENCPNSKARKISTIKARSGAIGELYEFTGDRFGNTELVVYFNGKNTINFFVMNSHDENDLYKNQKTLEELAQSYREADDCKPCDEPSNPSPCNGESSNV